MKYGCCWRKSLTKFHSPYSGAGGDVEDTLGVFYGSKIEGTIAGNGEEHVLEI